MICTLHSLLLKGTAIEEISIQVDISKRGFPHCRIVGLPHRSVAESRDRIKSAILNSGLTFPRSRTTINLSPADMPKQGAQLDVAIATALMCAQGYVPHTRLQNVLCIGELTLTGSLLPVKGLRAMVMYARDQKFETVYYPASQLDECKDIQDITCIPVKTLIELMEYLRGHKSVMSSHAPVPIVIYKNIPAVDFKHIVGQEKAKRALLIAATGRHHVLMKGPPGIGKTLLAQAMHCAIPKPSIDEENRIKSLRSMLHIFHTGFEQERPLIIPPATISTKDFLGSENVIGAVTKAYDGVLFLDELPEFKKECIGSLKHILESGKLQLVAAMNPCPCGNYGHPTKKCTCSVRGIHRYSEKISDAILDRIDIHIALHDVEYSHVGKEEKDSGAFRSESENAHRYGFARLNRYNIAANAYIPAEDVDRICTIDAHSRTFLEAMMQKYGFSMRVYHSLLRLSRTIADLDQSENIVLSHLKEAVGLRGKVS